MLAIFKLNPTFTWATSEKEQLGAILSQEIKVGFVIPFKALNLDKFQQFL